MENTKPSLSFLSAFSFLYLFSHHAFSQVGVELVIDLTIFGAPIFYFKAETVNITKSIFANAWQDAQDDTRRWLIRFVHLCSHRFRGDLPTASF